MRTVDAINETILMLTERAHFQIKRMDTHRYRIALDAAADLADAYGKITDGGDRNEVTETVKRVQGVIRSEAGFTAPVDPTLSTQITGSIADLNEVLQGRTYDRAKMFIRN